MTGVQTCALPISLLAGNRPFERATAGPTAGCEIRLRGIRSRWLIRLSDVGIDRDLDAFSARFECLAASGGFGEEIWLDDPEYGRVVFGADGRICSEERVIDPAAWTHAGQALVLPRGSPFPLPSHDLRG